MVKVKKKDVDKELEQQEEDFYGEESVGGHMKGLKEDDDVEIMYKKVYGNKPKGRTIAEAVEKDEKLRRGGWDKDDNIGAESADKDEEIERIDETSRKDHLEE
jgi:hypothetical protein